MDETTLLKCRVAELEHENSLLIGELSKRSPGFKGVFEIDPFISAEMNELRARVFQAETVVDTLKEDSSMTAFSSESSLGLRLLEKCRLLQTENKNLGECLISSRVSQLEFNNNGRQQKDVLFANQLKSFLTYTLELESRLAEVENELQRRWNDDSADVNRAPRNRGRMNKPQ